jgi:hypothetical protein
MWVNCNMPYGKIIMTKTILVIYFQRPKIYICDQINAWHMAHGTWHMAHFVSFALEPKFIRILVTTLNL